MSGAELMIFGPDGRRFLTYQEIATGTRSIATTERRRQREQAERQASNTTAERQRDERRQTRASSRAPAAIGADRLAAQLRGDGRSSRLESRTLERLRNSTSSLRDPQVLEQIKPALAGADQVEVAVAVDVDGGHLQPGAGRAGREVLEGQAVAAPSRVRSWPARPGRSRA